MGWWNHYEVYRINILAVVLVNSVFGHERSFFQVIVTNFQWVSGSNFMLSCWVLWTPLQVALVPADIFSCLHVCPNYGNNLICFHPGSVNKFHPLWCKINLLQLYFSSLPHKSLFLQTMVRTLCLHFILLVVSHWWCVWFYREIIRTLSFVECL